MAHSHSSSQSWELGKLMQRVDEWGDAARMKKQRADHPNKKENQNNSYIPGFPSTRDNGRDAVAERWNKDIVKEVEKGKQLMMSFKPLRLVLEKKVRNCAISCIIPRFEM